jgi:hypothetical protein
MGRRMRRREYMGKIVRLEEQRMKMLMPPRLVHIVSRAYSASRFCGYFPQGPASSTQKKVVLLFYSGFRSLSRNISLRFSWFPRASTQPRGAIAETRSQLMSYRRPLRPCPPGSLPGEDSLRCQVSQSTSAPLPPFQFHPAASACLLAQSRALMPA